MNEALTEEDRTTAIGLARFAYEYIDAARLVALHQSARSGLEDIAPVPAYFLALHGVELTLKAFLRHECLTAKELRGRAYGHDLRLCYRKAKECGLSGIFKMRADDMRAMLLLLEINQLQGLRYIRTGFTRYPSWSIVEPFAMRLHQCVALRVGYRSFKA